MSLSIHPFSLNPGSDGVRACSRVISVEERQRAQRYRRGEVTRRSIVARGNLRIILSEYTGIAPEDIAFETGIHGKPSIIPEQNPGSISFNLSHSHELGVVAVCRENDIGVDVEFLEKTRPFVTLARRYFSAAESGMIESLDPRFHREMFYRIWTLKESWLKATGLGITGLGLIGTASDAVPEDACRLRIVTWGEECCQMGPDGRPMDYRHFYPAPGYIAAYTRLYSSQIVSTR
ncbi:MAG TPA: 4'-phosphopantetheinyl transferase superfamily protein [bacterium]|nr:4'-phosphopantetheinyl transferase superfamily protein [bacterium]